MTHLKLQLVPQGVLPRDVGMSVQMTKKSPTVEPTESTDCPPLLVIETQAPVFSAEFSFLVVYVHDTRETDLTVTLTTSDTAKLAWVTNSPPPPHASIDADTTVVIVAGTSDIVVPIFGGAVGTDIIISAVAEGYPDASLTIDVEHNPIYPVQDVIYAVRSEAFTGQAPVSGVDIASSPPWGQVRAEAFGIPTIARPTLNDDNQISLTVSGMGVGIFAGDLVTINCAIVPTDGVLLAPTRIQWELTLTSGFASPTFAQVESIYGTSFTSLQADGYQCVFIIYGKGWGTAISGFTCDIPVGAVITITATLDGAPIDSIRSTFTLTAIA
jgi:hypothetical protein